MPNKFNVEAFLEYYRTAKPHIIETSVRAVLNRAVIAEESYNKPISDFTKEEALSMFREARAVSSTTVQNWNRIMKDAARWSLEQRGELRRSVYDELTKDDLKTCVDTDKQEKRFITREQLSEMQSKLNTVDSGILELLFLGVSGGEWARDLTYMTKCDLDANGRLLNVKGRKTPIQLDERAYNIIIRACEADEITTYGANSSSYKADGNGIFKNRCNTKESNDNSESEEDAERRWRWVQRRLKIISDYLEIKPLLTSKSLNASGFYHHMMQGMRIADIDDYKAYLKTEAGRELAVRYGFDSERYIVVIAEKFKDRL